MEKIEGNVKAMRGLVAKHISKHSVRDVSLRDLPPMEEEPVFSLPRCEAHPLESIDLSTVSTVIFATGYAMDFGSLIDVPGLCDEAGYPHQYRGVSSAATGLYFLGLPWLHKWASVTLLGAAEDAEYVANHIAKHVSFSRPSSTAAGLQQPLPISRQPSSPAHSRPAAASTPRASTPRAKSPASRQSASAATRSGTAAYVGTTPGQLYGDEALARPFATWLQLVEATPSSLSAVRETRSVGSSAGCGLSAVRDTRPSGGTSAGGGLSAVRDTRSGGTSARGGGRVDLTYGRLLALMQQHASLARLGIGRTDRVCSALPNGPEALTAFLAFSLACTYAPLNRALTEAELTFEFDDLPAKALVVMRGDPQAALARQVAEKMPNRVLIIEMVPSATEAGWFELEALTDAQELDAPPAPTRDDTCLVLHTSGTTNKPKIVPLTHANVAAGALCIASTLQLQAGTDLSLNVMPLFHIHGLSINVLATLLSGACVLASPGFDPERFFEWAQLHAPTWYSAVPTMHLRVLQKAEEWYEASGKPVAHSLALLRNCSAALLPSVGSRLEKVLDLLVMPTYAMTESMPICSNPRSSARDLKTVGLAGGPAAQVLGDDGEACAIDEQGEVCVHGAPVTAGYEYRDHMPADPNEAAFHQIGEKRWLRTGDKGFVNHAGHLTLVGRFKEIINRGGEKISPLQIEDVLRQHPCVHDLVIFSVRHAQLQEVAGAALVLRAGKTITLTQLRGFGAEGGLPVKWLPETLVHMTEIPKGPTGKPARVGLEKRLGLPELSDAGSGVANVWVGDAPDTDGRIAVRRFDEPAFEAEPADLDEFLATEADLTHSSGAASLTLSSVREAVRYHLRTALRREVADIIGLPISRVNLDMSLATLGVASIAASNMRDRVQTQLVCELPLGFFLSGSVSTLADHLSGLASFGTSALVAPAEESVAPTAPPPRRQATNTYGMIPLQTAYLIGRELSNHGAWVYWETDVDAFDEDRFTWAVRTLVARHEMLRTAMSNSGSQRAFTVDEVPKFELEVHRAPEQLKVLPSEQTNRWLTRSLQEARERAHHWLPCSYPMFDIVGVEHGANGRVRLSFLFDLLLADAATLNVLTRELSQLYTAPSQEAGLSLLPVVGRTHREHVVGLEMRGSEPKAVAAKAREDKYWAAKLDDLPDAPDLPKAMDGTAADKEGLSRLSGTLDKEQWAVFKAQCSRLSLTPTVGLLAAYAAVLSTYSSKHFTLTMANFSRGEGAEQVVGQLADVMLVEVDFRQPCSFEAAAQRLATEVWTVIDHSHHTSGVKVMSQINERNATMNQAVSPFVFASVLEASGEEPQPIAGEVDANLFKWFGASRPVQGSTALDTPSVFLDHQCFVDSDGSLFYNWDFQQIFAPGLISTMFEAYRTFLVRLSTSPAEWRRPPLLVPDAHVLEQLSIQEDESRPDLVDQLELIHSPFARLATTHAERAAVCGSDGSLTFAELHSLAVIGAHGIARFAASSRAPVGVMVPKSCLQLVAVLSVATSGRAYVPIKLDQPVARVQQILGAIEAKVVLLAFGLPKNPPAGQLGSTVALHLQLDRNGSNHSANLALHTFDNGSRPSSARRSGQAGAEATVFTPKLGDLAYIIFTSGSTGVPKGVAISHRGCSNTCKDITERFGVEATDVVLSLAALAFDLSVYDIFGVMAAGGRVVMPDANLTEDPEHWLDLLEREKVTVWNTAPPVMSMLLEYVMLEPEAAERFSRLPLRIVMLSGDFCALWVPTQLSRLLAKNEPTVYTLGGATEASIWSCFYHVTDTPPAWRSIPYGHPLANQSLYVLDAHLAIAPPLVPGQICIGGIGLAEGYYQDDAKTNRAFVYAELHGQRVRTYLTGDLGRYIRDEVTGKSVVEILGRLDFQVKIHGNRVEIGEVEAALRACRSVSAVVVMPAKIRGVTELIAFVESTEEPAGAKVAALAAAKGALPPYMVPSMVHVLEKLPLSANGKVDRKALLSVHEAPNATTDDDAKGSDVSAAEEPRTETEVKVHEIWQRVLHREGTPLNVFARFHTDLGGNSFALTKMRVTVSKELNIKVPQTVVLERETIVALAEWLDDRGAAAADDTPNIVCYQRSGTLPPFFCVAPVAGQVLCYKQLSEAMGPEQPFYALQSSGLNDDEEILADVPAIASALLSQVQRVVARFPRHRKRFNLGGWSFGGVVAFEMWLQLARTQQDRASDTIDGLQVGHLILLDSPAPIGQMPSFTVSQMLLTFASDLVSCRATLDLPTVDVLEGLDESAGRDAVLSKLEHVLPRETLERTFKVYCANLQALSAYRPSIGSEAASLRLHLVKASDVNTHLRAYPGSAAVELGWTQTGLGPSQILLYLQGGDHYFVTDAALLPRAARTIGHILDIPQPATLGLKGDWTLLTRKATGHIGKVTFQEGSGPEQSGTPRTPLASRQLSHGPLHDRFKMACSKSKAKDWDRAVLESYTTLLSELRTAPHLLIVACRATFPAKSVAAMLKSLNPNMVIHATSSCRGCITSHGHQSFGLLGIVDTQGCYTTALCRGATNAETARGAGREAAHRAMAAASGIKPGMKPAVAVINGAPSCEELVLAGIEDVLGSDVPVIGGSSADEDINGSWWAFARMPPGDQVDVAGDGIVVTLMWPSVQTKMLMSSPFQPTAARGRVTRASGRVIYEIDGKRAANVYADWSGSDAFRAKVMQVEAGGEAQSVLDDTTLSPLGRESVLTRSVSFGKDSALAETSLSEGSLRENSSLKERSSLMEDARHHLLVHPSRVVEGGGLECFAKCEEGELLVLMASPDGLQTLVDHPTNVMETAHMDDGRILGCLIVYCGGCARAIDKELHNVAQSFQNALGGGSVDGQGGGRPLLGMFTYGEQCRVQDGRNQHVNLMYAVLAFCESE